MRHFDHSGDMFAELHRRRNGLGEAAAPGAAVCEPKRHESIESLLNEAWGRANLTPRQKEIVKELQARHKHGGPIGKTDLELLSEFFFPGKSGSNEGGEEKGGLEA